MRSGTATKLAERFRDGRREMSVRMDMTPLGLVFHEGLLFTTSLYDAGTIWTVDPTTNGIAVIWAHLYQPPLGLAFDRSGNLFIACQDNVIRKIVDGSRMATTFASGLNYPGYIAFKPPPILHVRSQTNGVVLSWNDDSFALQAAPTPNSTFTNVSGGEHYAHKIATHRFMMAEDI